MQQKMEIAEKLFVETNRTCKIILYTMKSFYLHAQVNILCLYLFFMHTMKFFLYHYA